MLAIKEENFKLCEFMIKVGAKVNFKTSAIKCDPPIPYDSVEEAVDREQ